MGSKDKAKREHKKPAKKQPKVAPGRKRDEFNPVADRIGQNTTKS